MSIKPIKKNIRDSKEQGVFMDDVQSSKLRKPIKSAIRSFGFSGTFSFEAVINTIVKYSIGKISALGYGV